MTKFHLRANLRYRGPRDKLYFGGAPARIPHSKVNDRLYAFAMAGREIPRVFEYEESPDGIESLSNLIRSEEVIAIVKGRRVNFEHASVVTVAVDALKVEHRSVTS